MIQLPAVSVLVFLLALGLLIAVVVRIARWSWAERDLLGTWARGAGGRIAEWRILRPLTRRSPRSMVAYGMLIYLVASKASRGWTRLLVVAVDTL